MAIDFQTLWRHARQLEIDGQHQQAHAIYSGILKDEPDRLYVRMRVSSLERLFGHYREARMHALAAADCVRTGRWADLAFVTRLLLVYFEAEEVKRLIVGADWNHPDILRSSAVLAQHLALIEEAELSLQLAEHAQRQVGANHLLSYACANALRHIGRGNEATSSYERCIELSPNDAHAHWALANHQKARPPASRIERVRRALDAADDRGSARTYLHYALFKEYDDAGMVELAWEQLMLGAGLKRQTLSYDPSVEQAAFEVLSRVDTLREGSGPQSLDRVPIFIVGMPRTGTTLLDRIIGNHTGVHSAGELNDFGVALSMQTDSFVPTTMNPDVVEAIDRADLASAGRIYLERTERLASRGHFMIDKNPLNFTFSPFIARALPNAKILCMRREPMDACFSNLKELFGNESYGYSYDLTELAGFHQRFSRLRDHWQAAMPDRFMVVDYEELTTFPVNVAKQVAEFCGIEFDPESVDITRNMAPVSTASSSQVREPIHMKGVGAWRRYGSRLQPLADALAVGSA